MTIPISAPFIEASALDYVRDCVETGWVSSVGAYVSRFEEAVAAWTGRKRAVATSSGTSALHLALMLAGVRPGDEVLVPSLTFIATANAVRHAGAVPIFVDADVASWQISPGLVESFCATACRKEGGQLINLSSGRVVRAMLPVDVLGIPCDFAALAGIAEGFGLELVQDSTEALGSTYRGKPVGGEARMACFSFNGNKIITCGGGGMLVTDDDALADRAKHLSTQAKCDPAEYIHDEVGYNYRLTNLQAALGCSQMESLPSILRAKRQIEARYIRELAGLDGLDLMVSPGWGQSNAWLYTVRITEAAFGCDSRELRKRLSAAGVETRPVWQPLHLSPVYRGYQVVGEGRVAADLYRDLLSLPSHPGLTDHDQSRVVDAIRQGRVGAIGGATSAQ